MNFEIIKKIPVGKTPSGIAFNEKYSFIVISNRDSNSVEIYTEKEMRLEKKIMVGKHPYGISSEGDYIYTANVYDDSITVINLTNWQTKEIKVGDHPYNVIKINDQLFVTNSLDDNISIIDTKTFTEILKIPTGETPENLWVDKKNNRLVISNWGSDSISIINLHDMKNIKEVKSGLQSRAFGDFILN
jgi:YVTN family beta-propeller protein